MRSALIASGELDEDLCGVAGTLLAESFDTFLFPPLKGRPDPLLGPLCRRHCNIFVPKMLRFLVL